jgi:transcriptional regulator with XRE-family HTH domain
MEDRMLARQLGILVKERRLLRQLTQHELARLAGVSRTALSRIESPGATSSRTEVVDRVLRALGVRIDVAVAAAPPRALRPGEPPPLH